MVEDVPVWSRLFCHNYYLWMMFLMANCVITFTHAVCLSIFQKYEVLSSLTAFLIALSLAARADKTSEVVIAIEMVSVNVNYCEEVLPSLL